MVRVPRCAWRVKGWRLAIRPGGSAADEFLDASIEPMSQSVGSLSSWLIFDAATRTISRGTRAVGFLNVPEHQFCAKVHHGSHLPAWI